MPATSYDYALIRAVPHVERGECINVGVILFCRMRRFLALQTALDTQRLQLLAPDLDCDLFQQHLDYFACVCQGGPLAGPIGQLSQSERFHWLVAPRSTILQTSPVHSGLCTDPTVTIQILMEKLVLLPRPIKS